MQEVGQLESGEASGAGRAIWLGEACCFSMLLSSSDVLPRLYLRLQAFRVFDY